MHILRSLLRATEYRRRTTEEDHNAKTSLLFERGVDECRNIKRFGKTILSVTSVGDWTLDERDGLRTQSLRRNENGVKKTKAIGGDVEYRTSGMTFEVGIEIGNESCVELDIGLEVLSTMKKLNIVKPSLKSIWLGF